MSGAGTNGPWRRAYVVLKAGTRDSFVPKKA
jgi:hypothetical protein